MRTHRTKSGELVVLADDARLEALKIVDASGIRDLYGRVSVTSDSAEVWLRGDISISVEQSWGVSCSGRAIFSPGEMTRTELSWSSTTRSTSDAMACIDLYTKVTNALMLIESVCRYRLATKEEAEVVALTLQAEAVTA